MTDWNHDAESLFRDARETPEEPREGARARVRSKLALQIGMTAAAAATAGTATAGTTATGTTATGTATAGTTATGTAATGTTATASAAGTATATGATAKTVAVGKGAVGIGAKLATASLATKIAIPVLVLATGAGVTLGVRHRASPSSAIPSSSTGTPPEATPAHAPTPSTTMPATSAEPTEPADPVDTESAWPTTAPRDRTRDRDRARGRVAPSTVDKDRGSKVDEATLVAAIDAALRAGDTTRALELASAHERRFPHGLLSQEREGARIVARCMSGSGASAGADRFLSRYPTSPMRDRILAACGSPKRK